ncbi:MAG: DUF6228 family protein, partial [Acidimicrobiia bacterium]
LIGMSADRGKSGHSSQAPAMISFMDTVLVGSPTEYLRLTSEDSGSGAPEQLEAELHVDGLSASRTVFYGYTTGFRDLADLFGQLATDWRGWSGVRVWESIEGDLKIEARHQHGHVQLRVTLRHQLINRGNEGWSATADLTLEPGEQLSRIAEDLRTLTVG